MNFRVKIISLLIAIFGFQLLSAQELDLDSENTFKHSIRISPLNVFLDQIIIDYETTIRPKRSLSFSLSQEYYKETTNTNDRIRSYTLALSANYRFYLSKKKLAPKGFYISPGISTGFSSLKVLTRSIPQESVFRVGPNAQVGYQWIFNNGITIGAAYRYELEILLNNSDKTFDSVNFIKFMVGYSW